MDSLQLRTVSRTIIQSFRRNKAAWLLAGTAFILYTAAVFWKYHYFQYFDWDLAFFSQAMWNLSHGSFYVSLFDQSFLANHSNLIAFVFVPLYRLIPHPLLLVCLKIVSVVAGGCVFYGMARDRLGRREAVVLMAAFLAYVPNLYGILYEFHFESVAVVLIFLLYRFFDRKQFRAFCVTAILLMLVKENMPLIVGGFGVMALFDRQRNRWLWGGLVVLVAAGVFLFLTGVFIPKMSHWGAHPYIHHYEHLMYTPQGAKVPLVVAKPLLIGKMLFSSDNIQLLLNLLLPLAFVPVFSPLTLIPGVPILLQHMLSAKLQEHSIYYHYALTLAPVLFVALLEALTWMKRKIRNINVYYGFLVILTVLMVDHHAIGLKMRIQHAPVQGAVQAYREQVIRRIPERAAVASSFCFLPALANRLELYSAHKLYHPDFQDKEYPFRLPEDVEYLLMDFNDFWLTYHLDKTPERSRFVSRHLRDAIQRGRWTLREHAEQIALWTKQPAASSVPLVEIEGPSTRPLAHPADVTIDGTVKFLGFDQKNSTPVHERIGFELLWECERPVPFNYTIVILLQRDGRLVDKRVRFLGYGLYPTSVWQKGDRFRERYNLFVSGLEPGRYTISLLLLRPQDVYGEGTRPLMDVYRISERHLPHFSDKIIYLTNIQIGNKRGADD